MLGQKWQVSLQLTVMLICRSREAAQLWSTTFLDLLGFLPKVQATWKLNTCMFEPFLQQLHMIIIL